MTELIAQWAPTAVLSIVGWLLKNSIGRFGDRINRVETDLITTKAETAARHEAMERRVLELNENKADREDFIREAARTRQSLERLSEGVAKIDGKLDSGMHIAAGVHRLVDVMEKQQHDG